VTLTSRIRLGLATIAACTAATALYALLRIGQSLLFAEADPAKILWSEHAGYFWRAWTAAYVGGMLGFVAWIVAGSRPERVATFLGRALPFAALLLALQGLLVP